MSDNNHNLAESYPPQVRIEISKKKQILHGLYICMFFMCLFCVFQTEFEELFLKYDEAVQFQYLKSFRRVRVIFSSTENAKQAHANLNNCEICGQPFRCYFAQVRTIQSIRQWEVLVDAMKMSRYTGTTLSPGGCCESSVQCMFNTNRKNFPFDIALLMFRSAHSTEWQNIDGTELLGMKDLLKIQLHVNYLPRAWWLLLGAL